MCQLGVEDFLETGFDLKKHLAKYLQITQQDLEVHLKSGLTDMTALHPGSFSPESVKTFYEDEVGDKHLFDLASWHLGSCEYIADTIRLLKKFAFGKVIDFGGGIGTHSIAAANLKEVEHVYFVDLNPENRAFVEYRSIELGISESISVHRDLESLGEIQFDTIICFDVLEHMPNPSAQLLNFKKRLSVNSTALLNWYFYKGDNGEYPFHFDDKEMIEKFFLTLQENFIEIFHPFLITARAYRPKR